MERTRKGGNEMGERNFIGNINKMHGYSPKEKAIYLRGLWDGIKLFGPIAGELLRTGEPRVMAMYNRGQSALRKMK